LNSPFYKKTWFWVISVVVVVVFVWGGNYLYEQKKERDRQDLIHMGDHLKESWNTYDKEVEKIDEGKVMAEEYTKLISSVLTNTVSESEKDKVVIKVCKLEKELMERYPSIYDEPSSVCK
jgi:hypothetical protein